MIVTFGVIDHIVRNEAILVRVEAFLRENGQLHLADALEKLQQDAGLKYFNDIGNDLGADEQTSADINRVRDFVGDEDLEAATPLLDAYDEIGAQRLQVFELIGEKLRGQGGTLEAGYAGFAGELGRLAASASSVPPVPSSAKRDFSP